MTQTRTALEELAAKVEAGEKYETMGHTRLCQKAFPNGHDFDGSRESCAKAPAQLAILVWRNDDMNAALALHNAVMPGWGYMELLQRGERYTAHIAPSNSSFDQTFSGVSYDNPARALLLVTLKALIEKEKATVDV